jgi:DNA-binding MarR family transcriptional regulator
MSKSADERDVGAMRMVRFGNETPPVRRIPNALARRFFQICTTATAESVADADLAPLEFAVMAYASRDGGEPDLDQSRLAERLGVDRNNAGLLLERLEAKGLLERRINGRDRRARMVRLTPRGERLWQRLAPVAAAGQQRILAVLAPADREKLLDLLVQVIEGNWAMARPGAGRRKRGVNRKPVGASDGAHAARSV